MGTCATCGNQYDNTFTVSKDGESFDFDSFECAIHKLAPTCVQCGCRVVGHGVQHDDTIFCCAHCAEMAGETGLVDHN
ncbi:hypothetical protein QLQ85_07540 [Halomonas sp. M4R5S39]|uniref:Metallothionein n=1 Tax=Halomonas kalidii TaxID=3043293 RepID=A0ABT6VHU4_9GAMM|nr:hypothetical protein [Halomonas kalidii]MDI5933536.1 hypothetical protein [Halomonas kalidii]MDI5984639.1 hypothetical protein [Halomonas kalidii]